MQPQPTEVMTIEQSMLLADFARTCKAAARAVSLYPGAHPAIGSSLSRLVASTARLARHGSVKLAVHRELLAIEGRSPLRPDPSIGELATLLHERLIGRLTVQAEADAEDWRALLLLLARSPDDLITEGGIRRAWTLTGRNHFDIQEIDYAEVLRERGGGDDVTWDRIIAYCLEGKKGLLDAGALTSLLEALTDPARFSKLIDQLQEAVGPDSTKIGVRVAALLQLMRTAIDAARTQGEASVHRAFETIAASCAHLSPEMMIGMLDRRQGSDQDDADLVSTVADRMTDHAIASFMVRAVAADRKGTERLAHALEALAPDTSRKRAIVDLAQEEARHGELGAEPGFETMWEDVANAVMSYTLVSNLSNVSDEYGRELSAARRNAMEVEWISDDPPDRIQGWVTTVSESALAQLDLEMLLDLLRIEGDPADWEPLSVTAASEVEQRTLTGDIAGAQALVEALVRETKGEGRPALRVAAARAVDGLSAGPIARQVAMHFRSVIDSEVERFNHLCQTIGPNVVRTLADALAKEENAVAIRRLAALLLSFGAAGRRSVEQLKNSPNPAVRRTAITLLRRAGGQEALLELAAMIGDDDHEVQRESIHAMVEIGTANAYAVLHRLLLEADTPRDSALRELLSLRDDKAVPLFSYVLTKGEPKGRLIGVHLSMIESLGTMRPRPESIRALQQVLQRGHWWAPLRTRAQRQAAATSLRKLGTPEAFTALEAAANSGGRSVRRIARAQIEQFSRGEKSTT